MPLTRATGSFAAAALLVWACGGSADSTDDAKPAATPGAHENTADPTRRSAPQEPPPDACELIPEPDLRRLLNLTGELSASPEHMRVVGESESYCAWRIGTQNRLQLTIRLDPSGEDFAGLESMAAPGGIIRPSLPIRSHRAVARMDGSVSWTTNGRVFTLIAYDENGTAIEDLPTRRKLAELAAGDEARAREKTSDS